MEEHALAILGRDDLWNRSTTKQIQGLGRQNSNFQAVAPSFLHFLIVESQRLGGSVLDHFWQTLGTCDERLKENVEMLKTQTFVSAHESFDVLFRGLDPDDIDFWPVLAMAGKFFTHLGIAFMHPGGSTSRTSTEYSISDALKENRHTLYQQAKGGVEGEKEASQRQQLSLKALAFKRDGDTCLLTSQRFRDVDYPSGWYSELAHIIPPSVGTKAETLDCIAMFGGDDAKRKVEDQLNGVGNVLVMELDAHRSYGFLVWGIEGVDEGAEVKYYFRLISRHVPDFIALKDGDEIRFGNGPEGEEIEKPVPGLCNLELAVARVLKRSGAADIISKWLDDVDDGGYRDCWIASHEDVAVLDAKLYLSGKAGVV